MSSKEPTRRELRAIEKELKDHKVWADAVKESPHSAAEAWVHHRGRLQAEAELQRKKEQPPRSLVERAFSGVVLKRLERDAANGDERAAGLIEYYKKIRARAAAGEPVAPPPVSAVACATCRDMGFVRYEVPTSDPRFGKSFPCPNCGVTHQRSAIEATWEVPERTLALVDEPIIAMSPPTARLIKLVERVIDAKPRGVLILIDGGLAEGYGTAKTHALIQIYSGIWEAGGATALYTSAMQLEKTFTLFDDDEAAALRLDNLEAAATAGAERARRWRHLQGMDFVLIDEAARYTRKDGNGWVERHMMELVDSRLAGGKTVIMAGNHLLGGKVDNVKVDGIHPALIDRARSADGFILSLEGVSSGRRAFGRNAGDWHEGV